MSGYFCRKKQQKMSWNNNTRGFLRQRGFCSAPKLSVNASLNHICRLVDSMLTMRVQKRWILTFYQTHSGFEVALLARVECSLCGVFKCSFSGLHHHDFFDILLCLWSIHGWVEPEEELLAQLHPLPQCMEDLKRSQSSRNTLTLLLDRCIWLVFPHKCILTPSWTRTIADFAHTFGLEGKGKINYSTQCRQNRWRENGFT